jgi:hypothetical protein
MLLFILPNAGKMGDDQWSRARSPSAERSPGWSSEAE